MTGAKARPLAGLRRRRGGGPDESIDARELIDVATVHLGVALDYLGVAG